MTEPVVIGGAMLYQGDCLDVMRGMEDGSVDSIVCDPPYGLRFMGRDWDKGFPDPAIWAECLRVLKPGAHLLAFGGTRTFHRLAVAIEDAGWEIRDTVMWVYGSGFPKSLDVSKAIDKAAGAERKRIRGVRSGVVASTFAQDAWSKEFKDSVLSSEPITEAAKQWQGWGTALKPAWEPIIVARKPLEGTVAANVLKHGTGALNIDGCRVETDDNLNGGAYAKSGTDRHDGYDNWRFKRKGEAGEFQQPEGRFPANIIHDNSDEVLACFPDSKGQLADVSHTAPSSKTSNVYGSMKREGEPSADSENEGAVGFKMKPGARRKRKDTGSAARFFKACPDTDPEDDEARRLIYCAKASKKDRDEGCEGLEAKPSYMVENGSKTAAANGVRYDRTTMQRNTHPTVKPTALMAYLCRLVTPPGGIVLDPFMGSGSTGKAAMIEGFRFIGIEREAEYIEIARARIEAAQRQQTLNLSPAA